MIKKTELYKVLNENILSFWTKRMVDVEAGGFFGRIDGRGHLHAYADKAIILNTRILWTFSAVHQLTGNPSHKLMADKAYEYIVKHFVDNQQGGVFWLLNCTGEVINDKKQIYAQAFAIYAMAEYHKINPYRRALDHAIRLYELIEKYSFDPKRNGYFEAFDRSWGSLEDVRLSEKDLNASKTMNTHLHVLEAYTNLLRVWPDELLKKQLKNLVELMTTTFLDDSGHFKLFFNNDWKLQSHELSYGHDIEGSWLLCEAAEAVSGALTDQMKETSLKMVHAALEGMDEDGGLMNEGTPDGLTDTDKHWWPQAEALVGLVNAWELTGDKSYLEQAVSVWDFIKRNLMDPAGEWHWKVFRNGAVDYDEDKAGPWKGPYHNSRAMLELHGRL